MRWTDLVCLAITFVVLEGGLFVYACIAEWLWFPATADEDDYADEAY